MNCEALYKVWAPDAAVWSRWAKPVLFAQTRELPIALVETSASVDLDASWAPSAAGRTATVVDLPGADSVFAGLALARRGFRPVPLFNACAAPPSASAVLDLDPILRALAKGAAALDGLSLPLDAPPAFLIDQERMWCLPVPRPGLFDNRWMVFPQDFPSATFLAAHGIEQVIVLRGRAEGILVTVNDLDHVLRRWQEAGIRLMSKRFPSSDPPVELLVPRPSGFRATWYRALVLLGLRRNSAGGFGSLVPEPFSSGVG